ASIHLLHVAKDPILAVSTPELYGIDWVKLRDDIVSDAKAWLAALAETVWGVRVTWDVLVGRAADTIAQAAVDARADLIVMGTHGRGVVGHALVGSVADRVIRLATCPVMTVRELGAVCLPVPEAAASERQPAAQAS
ncbi:MAG: universal stress protein, partial [Vicinamibacterales bacterium]